MTVENKELTEKSFGLLLLVIGVLLCLSGIFVTTIPVFCPGGILIGIGIYIIKK